MAKLLQGNPALKNGLNQQVFAFTSQFNNALKAFSESLELLKNTSNPHEARVLPELVRNLHATLRTAIEEQHKKELRVFNNDKPVIVNQITQDLGVNPQEAQAIAENLLEGIKAGHKKQLENFDKVAKESHENVLKTAQNEYLRINLLNNLYYTNKSFKESIDAEHARRQQAKLAGNNAPQALQGNAAQLNTDLFEGIKLEDIEKLMTVTGTGITKDGKTLTVQLGPTFKGLGYSLFSPGKKVEHDLLGLAYTLRAQGAKKITMTVQCNDPEKGMELARKAYEACILAGYDPKDITIKAPDREGKMKVFADAGAKTPIHASAELFGQQAQRLESIHKKGDKIRKDEKYFNETHLSEKEAKDQIFNLKQEKARQELENFYKENCILFQNLQNPHDPVNFSNNLVIGNYAEIQKTFETVQNDQNVKQKVPPININDLFKTLNTSPFQSIDEFKTNIQRFNNARNEINQKRKSAFQQNKNASWLSNLKKAAEEKDEHKIISLLALNSADFDQIKNINLNLKMLNFRKLTHGDYYDFLVIKCNDGLAELNQQQQQNPN